MKQYFLTFLIVLISSISYAQVNFESQMDSITSVTQASEFIESHKPLKGNLITFNKEKHHTRLANDLFELGINGKKVYETEMEKTYYKLIERKMVPHYRVSYVFLDGNKKSIAEISKLKSDIISKYKKGAPFQNLAKQYSMDINGKRGGDSGWFAYGEMLPEFEDQIINGHHNNGDIFTIDVPSKKWYYVVLKTDDKTMIEEIKVLKIVEPILK